MYKKVRVILFFLLLSIVVASCGGVLSEETGDLMSPAQQGEDDRCISTIRKYLSVDQCRNWDEYHQLIWPESRKFQATPVAPDDPICDYEITNTVIRIMPLEEWWQQENPGKPYPESALPTLPNEVVYFVEYETLWQPEVVLPTANPISVLMWMIIDVDTGDCFINEVGW